MFEIFKLNKKKKELEDQIAQLKADISSIQVEIDNYDEHRQIAAHQYETPCDLQKRLNLSLMP